MTYRPFKPPPGSKIYLGFLIPSPFHRLIYTTSFTLLDQYGIFAFQVNYHRPFFTSVNERNVRRCNIMRATNDLGVGRSVVGSGF